jgi:hypothetical protein
MLFPHTYMHTLMTVEAAGGEPLLPAQRRPPRQAGALVLQRILSLEVLRQSICSVWTVGSTVRV